MWHKKCGILGWICLILVIIGGINWGLVGLFGFNLVAHLVGAWPVIERIVYLLVGLAAVILIFLACKCCHKDKCGSQCATQCEHKCERCNCSPCKCGSEHRV